MAQADTPGADHHRLKQVLPLGQWSRALAHASAANPIATVLPISGTAAQLRPALVGWTLFGPEVSERSLQAYVYLRALRLPVPRR